MTTAVVGNVNVDLLSWPVERIPPPGTERPIERVELRVGGAAAVAGAVLARLGAAPIVVGCVGDDVFATLAVDELRRYGVDTRHVRVLRDAATGASIAFEAPGRDRSFVIALGSLSAFEVSMVPPAALRADQLLLCGYFNLPKIRGRPGRELVTGVRARGGTTFLDTGWDHDGWGRRTRDEIASLLPSIDVFLPNEAEAARLSDENDPVAAAGVLARRSGGWAVVKLGPDGAVAVSSDGRSRRATAPRVEVVDTTGAGDAFNAGLMHAMARGADPAGALDEAVRVASTVVSRPSSDRYPAPDQLVAVPQSEPAATPTGRPDRAAE